MEALSLNKYFKIICKSWKIIAYFAAGTFVIALLFALFVFKPNYESTAKVVIKNEIPNTFVTDLNSGSQFTATSGNKNPVYTQLEILSSIDIAEVVWKKIKTDPALSDYPDAIMPKVLTGSIKLDNPSGTDIISIKATWDSPDLAQKISKAYVEAYYEYNNSVNKKSVSQKKEYILAQLEKSSKDLKNIRDEIKNYRKNNQSIDIGQESVSVISQISNIENTIATLDSEIKHNKRKSEELSGKLGINLDQAINSVAVGQNNNLDQLKQNLYTAQRDYATLNVRYSNTNPKVREVSENIKTIQGQIKDLTLQTIGNTIANKDKSLISDPVRVSMVDELVKSHTNYNALESQKNSLENTLTQLQAKQKSIPEKQKNLESLLQEEKTLTLIVDTLNTKLIEAQIKESEIVENISIVQSASYPFRASFPTLPHIFLLFEIAGIMLGVATVLGLYYVEDTCQGANEIEEILKAPVFGVIPWLTESSYKNNSGDFNPASIVNIIYQKIITSLKIRSYKKGANVLAFSSAEFEKRRPFISVNVAKSLAKCGKLVLLIDGDFRDGSIAKEFHLDLENVPDITELLANIYQLVSSDKAEQINELVRKSIIQIPDKPNLFVITNKNLLDNPYEIMTSSAFSILIEKVKKEFDFVIVDTPPMLAVPDTFVTAQYLDGIVVLCGVKTSRSSLRKVQKLCADNYVEILGAIARDTTTELELPENQYIKQLSTTEIQEVTEA